MKSKQKALLVAGLAREKKAEGVVALDMRKLSNVTDFFIIASASSTKRAQAISANIEEGLLKARESVLSIEGYNEATWILIDAYDVIAHIFNSDTREFYNLERLWSDAPKIRLWQKQKKRRSSSRKISKRK